MKTKRKRDRQNTTKKQYKMNKQQLKLFCKEHANTFNQFEEEYEQQFKDNLKKHHKDVEKELIKLFNIPFLELL